MASSTSYACTAAVGLLAELALCGETVHAQDTPPAVFLSPANTAATEVGEQVTLTLWFDGVGNPIHGGGFFIKYDPAVFALVPDSFLYLLTDMYGRPCDVPTTPCITLNPPVIDELNGIIEGAAGDAAGIGYAGEVETIAEFTLQVVQTFGHSTVELNPGGAGGPFSCRFDIQCTDLSFTGTEISGIALDNDGDGIADALDNCLDAQNPDQRDTDADNIGNLCDPDLNNDGTVDFGDVPIFRDHMFAHGEGLDADFNGDLDVNFIDLSIMKSFMFGPPGPSGIPSP